MTEFKGTPWPWEWAIMDHSMAVLHTKGVDIEVSSVMSVSPCKSCTDRQKDTGFKFGVCMTPNEADANLIAAAPELLGAVVKLRDHLNQIVASCAAGQDELEWLKAIADKAIGKALGKEAQND